MSNREEQNRCIPNKAIEQIALLVLLDAAEDKQGMEPRHSRCLSRQRDGVLVGGASEGRLSERLTQ
jgi:hypothetical protein